MTLRTQMLTLSLATLLVPWFGWMLIQELEEFLRANQAQALQEQARTMAASVPQRQSIELGLRRNILPLREFETRPVIDGYGGDWYEPQSALVFENDAKTTRLELLGGRWSDQDFLFLRVRDETPRREQPPGADAEMGPVDAVILEVHSARGVTRFRLQTAAPGPLLVTSQSPGGGQIEGYWRDVDDGYRVELALPPLGSAGSISVGIENAWLDRAGVVRVEGTGTLAEEAQPNRLTPAIRAPGLEAWLEATAPPSTRAWVIDASGWVVAESRPAADAAVRTPSWAERFLFWLVASDSVDRAPPRPAPLMRLDEPLVREALSGNAGSVWAGDPESAEIRNTVAVPFGNGNQGAIVLEANTDGALLFTNRTLGRLLLISLVLTLVLVLGLWFLATRLSRRVQSLSSAVSGAMSESGQQRDLPMTGDKDELGELARNNARLLRAVADYTRYLRTLAGRLSHELKTPLAITRTSLDNLAVGDLDEDSRRYLSRAQEGLDRQTAIVRAMSAASRLEAAVEAADWEQVDLGEVVRACVEAYRGLHPGRRIELVVPGEPVPCRCAPDLLAQALDKLVDNALSLMGPDDRVTVELLPKGNWRHLSVRNSGTRLPETLQDQLFDSLVSVRESGAGGLHLGLGLHIVRLVAEAHGGSVDARNLPDDGGVAFTLHLPAN